MFQKFSFLIILFCEFVIAQVPLPANGICPTFENCTDADIKNNSTNFGLAYLVSSVPYFFQADQKCTWYNFTEVSNSSILMEKYETDVETHKIRYSNGFLNKTSDRKVFLKYTDLELPMNFKVVHVTPEYWVVLACNDCGFFSKKGAGMYAYGMSRTPWPSCDLIGYNYLISSVPYFFQADQKCTWFNFTQSSNSTVFMDKYETDVETHKLRHSTGALDFSSSGKIFAKYTDLELPMNFKVVHVTPDYWIILACNDCGYFSKTGTGIYAYGMSRTPWPSCDVIEAINKKFEECGISKNYVKIENQDGCTKCR
ncbi:hypothetical protein PVAND_015696 [Polypedilum vanderplanki]|uniref:Uncharacterized protein n=1 Tax=Polypedilum vanderplanki TaxID=319348 RepID=A0A9J6BDA8_POLVA|nr:hypothetical protein PVAND_015696 [Polypedilum vanderplanki]